MKVQRGSDDVIAMVLDNHEAYVLGTLPSRLRQVLEDPEVNRRATQRFFPPGYLDEEKEAEYRDLLGEDLRKRKLEAVDAFERTLRSAEIKRRHIEVRITGEEFELWLGFVNDFRLLLGVELDIREDGWGASFDPMHPQARELALLHLLTWLEEELLRVGGFELPDIGDAP